MGPTLTIVRSAGPTGRTFGGYTPIAWQGLGETMAGDGLTFLFSLRDNGKFIKLNCQNKQREVAHCEGFLASFGFYDLDIFPEPKDGLPNSVSFLGSSYELPPGVKPNSD